METNFKTPNIARNITPSDPNQQVSAKKNEVPWTVFSFLKIKQLFPILTTVFLLVLVPITVGLARQNQEMRARASIPAEVLTEEKPVALDISVTKEGVGMIGDSHSDEYRADDSLASGTGYSATTLNWMEQIVRSREVNFGEWSDASRGEPRRMGYEYNWARTDSTTQTFQEQLTGLVDQIKKGEVVLTIIHIGTYDFAPHNPDGYDPIYDYTLTEGQLQEKINKIMENIELAIETLKNAGDGYLVVTNIIDWNLHPYVSENKYPNAAGRQRVTNAINTVNAKIAGLAGEHNIAPNDLNLIAYDIVNSADKQGRLNFGGELIDIYGFGDEPHNGFLSDQIHAGTVLEGIYANTYINTINAFYGTNIAPLRETEILSNAGIVPTP
ncbi:hypothetical protein KKB40_04370 [Patescibacteria group bacterium]|nr:hypothetical protein [Patescibacteria group bacterium]